MADQSSVRGLLALVAIVTVVVLAAGAALAVAVNGVRDDYRTCRMLGHGAFYCTLKGL